MFRCKPSVRRAPLWDSMGEQYITGVSEAQVSPATRVTRSCSRVHSLSRVAHALFVRNAGIVGKRAHLRMATSLIEKSRVSYLTRSPYPFCGAYKIPLICFHGASQHDSNASRSTRSFFASPVPAFLLHCTQGLLSFVCTAKSFCQNARSPLLYFEGGISPGRHR